jgi:phosphoesterase RecJ-like protein
MTDFPRLTLSECVDRLLEIENPLVIMHIRPDGDTVGSAAALCEIFKALGKSAKYFSEDGIPERLAFLTEGLERGDVSEGLDAVSIDVASPAQMGRISDSVTVKLAIDHHAVNTPFAPNYTVHTVSSAGEVLHGIAKELEARGLIKITEKIAYPIYTAISSDTGGFAFSNTTPETHRAAADLIELGIDHADINRRLFMSKSQSQIRAEGFVASKMRTVADGKIAYASLSSAECESLGLDISDFETAIDVVRSLMGTEIALVVKETDRGFKASMRSTGANVAEIAARHGGGGHVRAAGCNVDAKNVEEAADILLAELEALF